VAQRITLSRGPVERYFELALNEEALIARSVEARLLLWHPSVSRNHCKLRATAAGVEVENLSGKTTCTVNGQPVLPRVRLSDGDVLQVGALAFSVRCLDPPETTCGRCHRTVPAEEVRVTAAGELICEPCVANSASLEDPFVATLERAGCVVVERLGGDPPGFLVERRGRHLRPREVVKVIEMPQERPELLMTLREEAQALAWLDHPAIATILSMEEVEGRLLVFYPELKEETLEVVVTKRGVLLPARAVAVARACAEAIDHSSSRGVLHKNLTPANVLLGEGDRVTITNFSIARQLGDYSQLSRSFAEGTEIGSVIYWAPELAGGAPPADTRADVFGVGALLLYALVARCPWGKDVSVSGHLMKLLNGLRPPILLDGIPPALNVVLERLLAFAPADRPTPAQAIALLDEAIPRLGGE
jgi:serine/threonine protein kinase